MFSSFGKIKYISSKSNVKIKIQDLIEGINSFEDFIIYKDDENLKVFDRKCDHAGGKIISKNDKHICPMHNWEFNPIKGEYSNCIKKKQCNYKINNKVLIIEKEKLVPKIKNLSEKETHINIRFFNHAFLIIKGKIIHLLLTHGHMDQLLILVGGLKVIPKKIGKKNLMR